MSQNPAPYAPEALETLIFTVRGKRVMLDADLASIDGVATKRLNEQVRRNADRFPSDFLIRLTSSETKELQRLRSQFATLKRGQHILLPPPDPPRKKIGFEAREAPAPYITRVKTK